MLRGKKCFQIFLSTSYCNFWNSLAISGNIITSTGFLPLLYPDASSPVVVEIRSPRRIFWKSCSAAAEVFPFGRRGFHRRPTMVDRKCADRAPISLPNRVCHTLGGVNGATCMFTPLRWRGIARYCDTIAAIPPYSAIPLRGQLDVRYPPLSCSVCKQKSMR